MTAMTFERPAENVTGWHPDAAEVKAIVAELRPLIAEFAARDRKWMQGVVAQAVLDIEHVFG